MAISKSGDFLLLLSLNVLACLVREVLGLLGVTPTLLTKEEGIVVAQPAFLESRASSYSPIADCVYYLTISYKSGSVKLG